MIYDMRDDAYRALGQRSGTDAYVNAIAELLNAGTLPATASRTNYCPECGTDLMTPDDFYMDHVVWRDESAPYAPNLMYPDPVVIVGCEGYWVIDPAVVGIDSPNWSDWRADILDDLA